MDKTWVDTLERGSVIRNKTSKKIRIILQPEIGTKSQVRGIRTFHVTSSPIKKIISIERSTLLLFYEKMNLKYRFTETDLRNERNNFLPKRIHGTVTWNKGTR
jgi:hypothetical protein